MWIDPCDPLKNKQFYLMDNIFIQMHRGSVHLTDYSEYILLMFL